MQGIYRIRNTKDDYWYVGSATNIERRWKMHKVRLRTKSHATTKLQEAWSRDGEGVFVFEVIEEVADELDLLGREANAMSAHPMLYNSMILDPDRIEARLSQRKATRNRNGKAYEQRQQLLEGYARHIPDQTVMVFACLDCDGLHHVEHSYGKVRLRAIDRSVAQSLKERYVERHLLAEDAEEWQ
jgi:hypothetical protein